MEQKKIDTALENDKSMVESLFTKEVLDNYDKSTVQVPSFYFETFPEKLQQRIANQEPKTFFLTSMGKMAIAAVFIFVIGSTFIFLNKSVDKHLEISSISIQDISNDEIEAYVDANEWMADIDWHSEAYKPESEFLPLNSDSIE
ncbi:MAG: hypothetical protein ACR2IM_05930 [Sediminibacterium sp.]|jgi:hypothetical protein